MTPALRRVLPWSLVTAAVAIGLEFLATRPSGHEQGLVARAWRVGLGDSEASVQGRLGKPVRVESEPWGSRRETFEAAGERVVVGTGPNGVYSLWATPDVSKPADSFDIVSTRLPENPAD